MSMYIHWSRCAALGAPDAVSSRTAAWSKCNQGSAPARHSQKEADRAERLATASGARACRLQSCRCHRLLTIQVQPAVRRLLVVPQLLSARAAGQRARQELCDGAGAPGRRGSLAAGCGAVAECRLGAVLEAASRRRAMGAWILRPDLRPGRLRDRREGLVGRPSVAGPGRV